MYLKFFQIKKEKKVWIVVCGLAEYLCVLNSQFSLLPPSVLIPSGLSVIIFVFQGCRSLSPVRSAKSSRNLNREYLSEKLCTKTGSWLVRSKESLRTEMVDIGKMRYNNLEGCSWAPREETHLGLRSGPYQCVCVSVAYWMAEMQLSLLEILLWGTGKGLPYVEYHREGAWGGAGCHGCQSPVWEKAAEQCPQLEVQALSIALSATSFISY